MSRQDPDGIEREFEWAMADAMREDAAASRERRMRALFSEGRPTPIRFGGTMSRPTLVGSWPKLTNLHLDLLQVAKRDWMRWDGADRVEFTLQNAAATYVRTEPAEEDQDPKVITFRLAVWR